LKIAYVYTVCLCVCVCLGVFNSGHSSIRLVGSGGDCAGRLEVFLNGSWGTVCDDSWDIEDAQVVCRQLQCGVALSAHVPAWFGPGTGPIWLNEVQCDGSETSMWDCSYSMKNHTDCSHKEDAGVTCAGQKYMGDQLPTNSTSSCSVPPFSGSPGSAALPGLSASLWAGLPEQSAQ
uniref:SRCR domain-containing protein n=1 Tax=Electrophorus electricus TaxID=8005 RepID=A0A4W4E4C7_ELEEL